MINIDIGSAKPKKLHILLLRQLLRQQLGPNGQILPMPMVMVMVIVIVMIVGVGVGVVSVGMGTMVMPVGGVRKGEIQKEP